MPLLRESDKLAAAGTVSTILINKPAGNVVIKKISISSAQVGESTFVRCQGILYEGWKIIGLYQKVVMNLYIGQKVFDGEQVWPHNWKMRLKLRGQGVGELIHYIIEYEIPELEDPRRRRWGQ